MARKRNGGDKMAYGAGSPGTPDIEQQETPRRTAAGKGLTAGSFSDAGTPFEIFAPHAPARVPGAMYEPAPGPGLDNTREIASRRGRTARSGRGARG